MEQDVFTELYRRHAGFVYAVALSDLRNPPDAEDVTADVFIQLLESDAVFRSEAAVRKWLMVCTRNRCKNLKKSRFRRRRIEPEDMEQIPAPPDSGKIRLSQAMETMGRLPEKYRLPLMLYAVQGYAVPEIAALLGIAESTVRTRIERAREKMRREMEVG